MSAPAVTTPHPVLYLVPGAGRSRRARPGRPVRRSASPDARAAAPLPTAAAELAALVLGTLFAPFAAQLAVALGERAPLLARRGRPEPWAAAIVFLLAEESELFRHDCCTTRTSLARELATSLPTLRRRAEAIRAALDPLHLELPEPDFDAELE